MTASVSVVVPVRDGAPWLMGSLESILRQTRPPDEVIVMDDASVDGSAELAASLGPAVTVVRRSVPVGQFDNVNEGLDVARGEYVCVFHADDVYEPTIVEREATFLDHHPTVAAVFCQDRFIDLQGREVGRLVLPADVPVDVPISGSDVLDRLLRHRNVFLRCPTAMVRAGVYRHVGRYDQSEFPVAADLDMWVRIARDHDLAVLGEHLLRYRSGHGSAGGMYQRLRTEPDDYFRIMDRELSLLGTATPAPSSLRRYEAHRAADRVSIGVSRYINGNLRDSRDALAAARLQALAGGRTARHLRLAAFLPVMRVLARLPRSARLAESFYRHWHSRYLPARAAGD